MEVYLQQKNSLKRVHWISSLPEKYLQQIREQVSQMEGKSGKVQVILRESEDNFDPSRSSNALTYAIRKSNPGIDPINNSLKKRFKSHPSLFTKNGEKVRLENADPGEAVFGSGTIPFNDLPEEIKTILKFPQEFYNRKKEIGSTYCLKYLGVTNGKMGVLSKRIPMQPAQGKLMKTKKSVVMLKYPDHGLNDRIEEEKSFSAEQEKVRQTSSKPLNNNKSAVLLPPIASKDTAEEFYPDPEENNAPLVHQYSVARPLPVYKKIHVISEAEKTNENKYSKIGIGSAIYDKICGFMPSRCPGLKGKLLSVSQLFRTRQYGTKPRQRNISTFETNQRNVSQKLNTSQKNGKPKHKVQLPSILNEKETPGIFLSKLREQGINPMDCIAENNKIIMKLLNKKIDNTSENSLSESPSEFGSNRAVFSQKYKESPEKLHN